MNASLPPGWTTCKIGQVLEFKYGKALPASIRDGAGFPVFGSNGVVGHHSSWLASAPTIVIGRKGSVGEVCFSSENCSPIDTTYYVDEFDAFNPKLCFYLLKCLDLGSLNKATAIPGLNRKDAYGLQLSLPPLAEQTRIAAKLDELLAQVDTLKARIDGIPALLKRFRQSVLAAAVSGRLTEEWRRDNENQSDAILLLKQTQAAKLDWVAQNSDHNEAKRVTKRVHSFAVPLLAKDLPKGWSWSALEDAVLMVVDCHNKTAPYKDSGIPLIRTTNVRNGEFSWQGLRFVDQETYEFWSRRCPPEPGDIVFTREAPMGEAAIIPAETRLCLGQRTMLIRCQEKCTSPEYMLLALLDPAFRRRSEKIAVGSGVKHFRVGDVSNLTIAIAPKCEQTEIVRRVEQLFAFADQLEARVAAAQERIDKLTQSILAKAFRGELVPQDPNDEPASVLLERIKAQRAAAPKTKRGRKAKA